jgi:hypothetical protein
MTLDPMSLVPWATSHHYAHPGQCGRKAVLLDVGTFQFVHGNPTRVSLLVLNTPKNKLLTYLLTDLLHEEDSFLRS